MAYNLIWRRLTFSINKERNFSEKDLQILIDATEIQTQRPAKNQRKFFSGKKKKHTQKMEIITDLKNVMILADSGYQGLQKIHKNTVLPFKRQRKCPLTQEKKAHNQTLASKRIGIEHAFAKLKKFKILGSIYRNFKKKLLLKFNIIAGIYNLQFA